MAEQDTDVIATVIDDDHVQFSVIIEIGDSVTKKDSHSVRVLV